MTAIQCRTCSAMLNEVNDLPFVELGRGAYCSLACVRMAMLEIGAEKELVFRPDPHASDSLADKHRRRLRQAFMDVENLHPRVCVVCCNLETLQKQARAAQQQKPGAFYDVTRAAEARYPLLASFFGAAVCSFKCAMVHLERVADFDQKGHWIHAPRCTQCGVVERFDCDQSFADIALVGDREGMFCSSACLFAFLESEGAAQIRTFPFNEAVRMGDQSGSYCGCIQCGKNSNLPHGDEDPEVKELETQAEKLVNDLVRLPFDSPVRQRMQEESDALYARARALLRDHFPLYALPFLFMDSGFGPPVDGGAVFCSVQCIRGLFSTEPWFQWDAKGAWRPRPDGLGHRHSQQPSSDGSNT